MEKLSRKEREYRSRREDILKSAERVFAQNGFYNTTVAEIAKESEFAIGTLYQFFKNKEELYYTMMIEKFDLLHITLKREVDANKKFLQKLNSLVETVLSFIEQNVDFFLIFTWELNVLKPNMENKLKKQFITKHFAYMKLISDVIKQGLHKGVLKDGNVDDLSSALLGMMNIFAFNWIFNQQQKSLREKAPVIVNLFLHGSTRTGTLPRL
jgi:AcrR family transcriptional regulator